MLLKGLFVTMIIKEPTGKQNIFKSKAKDVKVERKRERERERERETKD